jgi:putative membrane protein
MMISFERANLFSRVTLLSLVGLVLVPLLIAGGFLWATWDSDSRLDKVEAAVINLDEPVKLNGQLVPLGRQLAGGLVSGGGASVDSNFTWVITDQQDAAAGMASGKYSAAVTIPEDFSARATSFTKSVSDQIEPAEISVEISPIRGIADTAVGQSIAAAATNALNNELTEQYLENIYVGFNTSGKRFRTVAKAADELSHGTTQLADGLGRSAVGADQLADGLSQLDNGAYQLSTGATQLSNGVSQLSTGVGRLSNGLDDLADGTTQLPKQTRQLAKGIQQLAGGTDDLATGATKLAEGAEQFTDGTAVNASGTKTYARGVHDFSDGLSQYTAGVSGLASGLGTYSDAMSQIAENGLPASACPEELADISGGCEAFQAGVRAGAGAAVQGLNRPSEDSGLSGAARQLASNSTSLSSGADRLATGADGLAAGAAKLDIGARRIAAGVDGLATAAGELATGAGQLADGTDRLADGMKPLAAGISGASTGAARLASGISQLAAGASQIADGTTQLADGTDQSAGGARQLSGGLTRLSGGGDKLADGTTELADGLAKGTNQVPTYDKTTRTKLAEVVSTPVTSERPDWLFADIANTTFLAIIALWLGGLASFIVLRPVPSRALASMKPSWWLAAEAMAPAATIAVVQAIALSAVLHVLLDLRAGQVVALLGLLSLAGVAFVALNQSLVAWFRGIGRFISVAIVVLSAAAAITSAVPPVLTSLVPFLPLTPALEGARAIASDGTGLPGATGVLFAWFALGVAAAVVAVARRRMLPPAALAHAG